ncbi:amino acid permease [Solirubrobacter ginsenosidimutans]|uniref:Amino acid permease n=1 Tax=Solirubrobacter ginsenosidimutans TaxID=490573 RepID=A0A9X3S6U9_9ACTN|nr:amino acid permease [Solirubrobacter ginsenosidimutans]MDA0162883.1 amino acid permease [Solirubrobacter ginsenosidimutans]
MAETVAPQQQQSDDERRLAELGYTQALQRSWSSFSNFAISFTIISVLAGCFTTYGQAWNNGGPIAISWGWPIICGLILLVAFSMSELVSAYPTAGGIYYWASTLGGPKWGWFTGWFNLVGLVGVVASVDYGCAQFMNATFTLFALNLGFANWGDSAHILSETFLLFMVILTIHALINIYSSPLVALFNNISVFWHVAGVTAIVLVLAFVPDTHQSVDFVFTQTINNSGFGGGMFWFYVLPLGFLLTMYTQTGYDASAHISEETHGAAKAAAQGVWRAVFWSGVGGWIVLLAITFAATDVAGINKGAGSSLAVFATSLPEGWQKVVVLIATIGQLFCGMACVTSCSRMTYAFSRDRAVPGWRMWTRLNHHRVPAYAVVFSCVAALIMTLPALEGDANGAPYAFFAVVSICVIGLYIAYVLPIYLRWRKGDDFVPGPWTLGQKYKWINPAAIIWVAICVIIFCLPFTPAAVPWRDEFDWKYVNYAPITVGAVLLIVGIWWAVRAKHTFTGPVRTVEFDDGAGLQ